MTILTTIFFLGVFGFGLWSVLSPLMQRADQVLAAMAGPESIVFDNIGDNVVRFERFQSRAQGAERLAA
jgi:hypothetical protein